MRRFRACLALAIPLAAVTVFARQTTPPPAEGESNVQDTPIAVTAITADAIERA
jgi:hypothetical protein